MALPFFQELSRNNTIRAKYSDPNHLVFSDEFLGAGNQINPQKWRAEFREEKNPGILGGQYKYQADLNQQSANANVRADGTYQEGHYTNGKRFSGWQNKHRDRVQYRQGGYLNLGGYASDEEDPTSPTNHPVTGEQINPYFDPVSGRDVDMRKKVYTSWIDSSGIARVENHPTYGNAPFVDPNSPRHGWRGGYFEADFDFRGMNTPGYRCSWWLMPYCNPDVNQELYPLTAGGTSVAGDNNGATGAEIDIFELEPSERFNFRDTLLMKVPLVGGSGWGKRNVVATEHGFSLPDGTPLVNDLYGGMTTIGLEWNEQYLGYYVNGVEVNRDYDRVPQIGQYFNVTREFTAIAGIEGSAPAFHPWRPSYANGGWLWGDNGGAYRDRMNSDVCKVGYIRVWQNPQSSWHWKSPHNTQNAVDLSTPTGDITRYQNAPAQGFRFGVPTRYSPNLERNDIDVGDTTVSISTTSVDGFNLRYKDGKMLWEAQGRTSWDVKRANVDNVNNPDDYLTSTSVPQYDVNSSGLYFVTATNEISSGQRYVSSQVINIVLGSNSIDKDGIQLPTGGTDTGTYVPPDVPTDPATPLEPIIGIASSSGAIPLRTIGFIDTVPEMIVGVTQTITVPLPDNDDGTPASPADFLFQWTVPDGMEIIGPSDQYEVSFRMTDEIVGRVTRYPTCEVLPKDGDNFTARFEVIQD